MRVINRDKVLATFAHRALRGKEIFRRSFVADESICSDILRRIKRICASVDCASDQSAAFVGSSFASMRDNLGEYISGDS